MKYVDVTDLFDADPAELALLSTYQFDPDFFERRLLRTKALSEARRIAVFMDATQWADLLGRDVPARLLNRRYLVIPVSRLGGVFHPKLGLLLREDGGRVLCGSNNLTRCGCSSNLEILNALEVDPEIQTGGGRSLTVDAYDFFLRAADDAVGEPGRIVRGWLEEYAEIFRHSGETADPGGEGTVRLVHTYTGSLWEQIVGAMDQCRPDRFLVISPFFDPTGELFRRIHRRYPACRIEVVAQQKTSNPPTEVMKDMRTFLDLTELRSAGRRLHAKLLAWEGQGGAGCLVGSANFTLAALDGRNVETCLLVDGPGGAVGALFDGQLSKTPIEPAEFVGSGEEEPQSGGLDAEELRLISAVLDDRSGLTVEYVCRIGDLPLGLTVAMRRPGEHRDPFVRAIPVRETGSARLAVPPDVISDSHGTILATLIVQTPDGSRRSDPIWVIQENRLTVEREGQRPITTLRRIEETGHGLPEHLEELGEREGMQSVIEFLQNTSIRYFDGEGRYGRSRPFCVRMSDPFQPDFAPAWLINDESGSADLETAIHDFVDRHEKQRLLRHARSGNVNGLPNFLDIFTAMVRLLYVYHRRGIVKKNQLNGRLIRYIQIATNGLGGDDSSTGFLETIAENLRANLDVLIEASREANLQGHLSAVLLMAQKIRLTIQPVPPSLSECLPQSYQELHRSLKYAGLVGATDEQILHTLQSYGMFEEIELLKYQILLSSAR